MLGPSKFLFENTQAITKTKFTRPIGAVSNPMVSTRPDQRGHPLKNKKNLITIFDRLSTYSLTRLGFIHQANAFSDHPSIINRIKRVKDGSLYILPEPLQLK